MRVGPFPIVKERQGVGQGGKVTSNGVASPIAQRRPHLAPCDLTLLVTCKTTDEQVKLPRRWGDGEEGGWGGRAPFPHFERT